MRFGVHLGPFWVGFGGRRRREQPAEEAARQRRIAAMTPDEYGRHLGMSDEEIARALVTLTAEDRQEAGAELQRLRHEMGYRDQD